LFFTGNSILNRCKIKFSIVKRLSRESEIEIFGRVIKLPRNVQMARIKVPGFGKLNAYNTHLCAGCSIDERDEQLGELFDFLDLIENFIPGTDPILLAGDFNIDIFKDKGQDDFGPEKEALYEDITDRGFVDAYAEVFGDPSLPGTLLGLCRNEDDGDVHCTVGITAFDELDPGNASRIDYVFRWGFGSATAAEVFFNPTVDNNEPDELVADHSAAYIEIPLQ
jgi:maltose 6'-phosphate phosphatase